MRTKYYDSELGAELLQTLKKQEILTRANPAQGAPLIYNIATFADQIEETFQQERKRNPVLETTAPEAWLAAIIIPEIQKIRPNVDVSEGVLSVALQRYFRRAAKKSPETIPAEDTEKAELHTTLESYMPGVQRPFSDLLCRTKSLRGILRLPRNAYTIREAMRPRIPTTKREEIFLQGIREGWTNPRIARKLDELSIKPQSRDYKSFTEMFRLKVQLFYSLKSAIKEKYASAGQSATSTRESQR